MTRATIAVWAGAALLALLIVAAGYRALTRDVQPEAAPTPATTSSTTPGATAAHPPPESHQGFLYGRITAADGTTYEGRLRFGGEQEAFWGDYFIGAKRENPWAAQVPAQRLPTALRPIELLGIEVGRRERPIDLGRPFTARFGEIARIGAQGRDVRVILESGTVVDLDSL